MGTCCGKIKHKSKQYSYPSHQHLETRPTHIPTIQEDSSNEHHPSPSPHKLYVISSNYRIRQEFTYHNRLSVFSIIIQLRYYYPFFEDKELILYHNQLPITDQHIAFPEVGIEPGSELYLEIRNKPKKVEKCNIPLELQEIIGSSLLRDQESNHEINYTYNLKECMMELKHSHRKEVLREALMKTIYEFQKNLDEKGYRARLYLEFTGSTQTNDVVDSLIDNMHIILYNLAYDIHTKGYQHCSETQDSDLNSFLYTEGFTLSLQLTPWLDRAWRLMISYTNIYYNFCKSLVGRPINRLSSSARIYNLVHVKKIWPRYNLLLCHIEDDYTVWVSPAKYLKLLRYLRQIMFKRSKFYLSYTKISLEAIMILLRKMRRICDKRENKLKTKISNNFNNSPSNEEPKGKNVRDRINQLICKEDLVKSIQRNLIYDEDIAKEYVEEYINYLTLLSFSDLVMIPSDQIEQVFKIHQNFSENYRVVTREVYKEFRYYNPINPVQEIGVTMYEQYNRTKQLYPLILNRKATHRFWPSSKCRFSYKYLNGRWVSLIRLLGSFITQSKLRQIDSETSLVDMQEALRIPYMKWPNEDESDLEILNSSKSGDLMVLYNNIQESYIPSDDLDEI